MSKSELLARRFRMTREGANRAAVESITYGTRIDDDEAEEIVSHIEQANLSIVDANGLAELLARISELEAAPKRVAGEWQRCSDIPGTRDSAERVCGGCGEYGIAHRWYDIPDGKWRWCTLRASGDGKSAVSCAAQADAALVAEGWVLR
jgi:hypothetical protein